MSLPAFLQQRGDALQLAVRVRPRARRTALAGSVGAELKIRVAAPPVDSAANEALIAFVAETLGLHRRAVTLVRGAASRSKLLRLEGMAAADAAGRLLSTAE